MKKIRSKLSLVLLLILSFVVMLGAAASMLVHADTKNTDEPAVMEVYSDDWYEITITEDSLTILFDARIGSYRSISRDDLTNIKNAAIKAVKTLVIEKILNDATEPFAASPVAINAVMPIDASDDLKSMSQRYKDYLFNRLTIVEDMGNGELYAVELDKFLHGEYDALIEYAASQYINDGDHADVDLEELTRKVHAEVLEVIDDVLGYLSSMNEVVRVSGGIITEELKDDIYYEAKGKLEEVTERVWNNGGQMSLSITQLLDMVKGVKIGGIEVYNGDKFVLDGLKQLIATLPTPAEIANMSDDQMNLSYNIFIETSLGNVDFDLTVGFKGDASDIRKAAQFIADHFSLYNDNGVYTVEVNVSEGLSAVLLKLSETDRIPDDVKLAVFGLFNKTGDEIFDKATGYSYDQIISYLKGKDFQGLFTGMLDAQKIKDFFKGFDIDLSELTDENIDKLVNKVLEYAEKVANKKTVEGVEEFLKGYGIPGIPAELEGAVQKFMDLLNKIDYSYVNATTIREFLSDKNRVSAKVDAVLSRLADSATAQKIYDKLIEYAERLFKYLPDQIHNGTILDLYEGNGEMSYAGDIDFDVKEILTKLINKLAPYTGIENAEEYSKYVDGLIDSYFEGDMHVNVSVALKLNLTDIYKVEYVANEEVVAAGLLPVGADIVFYANMTTVDGCKIVAWVDEDGNEYEEMPAKDVTLYAVTEFEAYIAENEVEVTEAIEKVYDGEPIVLTVEFIGAAGANPKFTWYKDGEFYDEIVGVEGATLKLVNVADSGVYYCEVTNSDYDFLTAETQEVEIIINKAPLELTVSVEDWTYGDTASEPVIEGNVENGEVTYLYEGEGYSSEEAPTEAGEYKLTIKVAETDNYLGGEAECTFTVLKAKLELTVSVEDWTYGDKASEPEIEGNVENGKVTYLYEGEGYSSEEAPTEAGDYKLTIKVEETDNYLGGEAECTFTVLKAELELELTLEGWTYGKDANDYVLKGNVENGKETCKYEGEGYSSEKAPTNAGTYTLTVTVDETANYKGGTASCEFTITKATINLNGYWDEPCNYVYDGTEKYVVFEHGAIIPDDVKFTVYGDKATDAGDYKAYFVLIYNENNYNVKLPNVGYDEEHAYPWSITKATLEVEVYPESNEYNGEAQLPVITVKGINGVALDAEDYKVTYKLDGEETTPVHAGVYTITIELKGLAANNYKEITEEFLYEITASTLKVDYTPKSSVYNREEQKPEITVIGANNTVLVDGEDYKVTYTLNGEEVKEVKNAGVYTVTITLLGDAANNYAAPEEFKYEITKATLNMNGYWDEPDKYVYDGTEKHVVFSFSYGEIPGDYKLPDDVTVEVFGTTGTNAGDYKAYFVLTYDENNYNVILPNLGYDKDHAYPWTIAPAIITIDGIEFVGETEFTFDGAVHSISYQFVEDVEFPELIKFESIGVWSEVNVGVYEATLKISSTNPNYKIDEDNDSISIKWEIKAAIIDLSDYAARWDLPSKAIPFDGAKHVVELLLADGYSLEGLAEELLVNGYTFGLFENNESEVGTYNPYVRVVDGKGAITNNYVVIGVIDGEWSIVSGIEIDLSAYHWSITEVEYNGSAYTVKLLDASGNELDLNGFDLPDGYTLEYRENEYTAAGTYNAYIAVFYNGAISTSYEIILENNPYQWTIKQITIDEVTVTLEIKQGDEAVASPVYNGEAYVVAVIYNYEIGEYFTATVEGDELTQTNAGEYTVTVTLTSVYDSNYIYNGQTEFTLTWNIAKAEAKVESAPALSGNDDLVYDGDAHTVEVNYVVAPASAFNVTIGGDALTQTGAGEYTVVVTVEFLDTVNYNYAGQNEYTLTWTISKAEVKLTAAPALVTDSFTYSGEEHTVEVDYTSIPANVFEVVTGGAVSATNAGTYHVTVTISLKEEYKANYAYTGETVFVLSWTIAPQEIGEITGQWLLDNGSDTTAEFNGQKHTVSFIPADVNVEDFIIYYEGVAESVNVGEYTAKVVILSRDGNYSLADDLGIAEFTWTITPATVDLTGAAWDTTRLTYNGETQGIELNNLPDLGLVSGYELKYYGNEGINAGTYYAHVAIVKDGELTLNYVITGLEAGSSAENTYKWSIAKKALDVTATWSAETSFVYDGTQHRVTLNVTGADADKVAVDSRNDAFTNAGVYMTTATLTLKYEYTNNYAEPVVTTYTISWEIAKKEVVVTTAWSTSATEFEYNGGDKIITLNVTGADADKVAVSYVNNSHIATEIGSYTTTAILTLKSEYSNNYTLADGVYTYSWKIVAPVVPETKSEFTAEGGDLPEGVKVTVTASKPLPEDAELVVSAISPNEYSDDDFKPFVASGTKPSLFNVYAISITNIPADYDGTFTVTISNSEFAGRDLIVVHIPLNADGTPVDKEEWSNTDANLAGNNLTFATPGFSDFAVVEQLRENNSLWLMWLMIAIIIILLIIIIILVIRLLRKKNAPQEVEAQQHPVVIIKTVEKEVVKEVPVEVPAEEPAAVVEEAPAKTEEALTIADDGSRIIYDKSFVARLTQADDTLKSYYNELKNHILSYKGVKSRISWHFDSFNKGRETCVKLQFRGKSLYMYIALSKEGMPEKYRLNDVSDKSRYDDVPTMIRIRKPRSLKYAKQLVDILMNKLAAEQGEIPNVNYKARYKSTNSLIEMGLIKVKTTKNTFIAPKSEPEAEPEAEPENESENENEE